MARLTALTMNAGVLLWIGYMLADQGAPRGDEWMIVLLIGGASASAIWALLARGPAPGLGLFKLISLEIEARQAVLRKRIAQAERDGGDA